MRGIENFLVGIANGLAYFGQDRLSDENLVQLVQHNFISSFYFNRSENILPQVKYYGPAQPSPAQPSPAYPTLPYHVLTQGDLTEREDSVQLTALY